MLPGEHFAPWHLDKVLPPWPRQDPDVRSTVRERTNALQSLAIARSVNVRRGSRDSPVTSPFSVVRLALHFARGGTVVCIELLFAFWLSAAMKNCHAGVCACDSFCMQTANNGPAIIGRFKRQVTACFMHLSTPLNTALFSVQKSSQPQPLIHAESMRAARAAAPWTPSTDWLSRCCEPWKRDRSSSTQLPRVALCCVWQQLKNSVLKVPWNGLYCAWQPGFGHSVAGVHTLADGPNTTHSR